MKKNTLRTLGVSMVVCCSFSSCFYGNYIDPSNVPEDVQKENIYYIPSSSNIPSLYRKNDLNIGLNSSIGTKIGRTDIYGGYAPLKNVGLFASYGIDSKNNKIELAEGSLAVGYLTSFSPLWHFETYGGIDKGYIQNTHYTGNSKLDITRWFLQPAISIHNIKKTLELSFVSRFTTAGFNISDTTFNQSGESFSADQFKKIASDPHYFFWEPGLSARFGSQKVLLNLNYTTSALLKGENFYRSTYCFSFGAVVHFNVSKK